MNIKKLLLGLGAVSAVSVPIAGVVACGTKTSGSTGPIDSHKFRPGSINIVTGKFKDATDIKMYPQAVDFDWSKISYFEAKIVKWIDGDTPTVDIIGGTAHIDNPSHRNIRVSGIDTPELHVKNEVTGKIDQLTTGTEFKYANAARIYANSIMPTGSIIRIPVDGSLSYQRIVGHIFYGPNFKNNFEVNILKKGLALPFITDAGAAADKSSWEHYAYREMADAFNFARDKKIGILSEGIEKVSIVHGSTSLMNVNDYGNDADNASHRTIYYYTKDLK